MLKKISVIILGLLVLFLFLGCAKPAEEPSEIPEEAESPVDEIGTEITDINNVDEELDSSELDDLDVILEDIENI